MMGQGVLQPGGDATEVLLCARCAAETQPTPRIEPNDEVSAQRSTSAAGSGRLM